jgi:hypothetical protein
MKKTNPLFILPLFFIAGAVSNAAEPKIDFDGGEALSLTPARGLLAETLDARLVPPAGESALPETRWGDIPPANGPSCEESPYGCPGQGGGSGGGQEPVPPAHYSGLQGIFPAAVYVNTDLSNPAPTLMTGEQAAIKLGATVIKNIFVNEMTETMKFKFPYQMSRVEAIKAMAELELELIKRVKTQLSKDLQKIMPMPWESQEQQQLKLAMIRNDEAAIDLWWRAARGETADGRNWTELTGMTFTFKGGQSYKQLGRTLQCRNCFRSKLLGSAFEDLLKN